MKKKLTNMEVLETIISIDDKMQEDGVDMLTPKCRQYIEDILQRGNGNAVLTNHELNKGLRPSPNINLGEE